MSFITLTKFIIVFNEKLMNVNNLKKKNYYRITIICKEGIKVMNHYMYIHFGLDVVVDQNNQSKLNYK